jgi:kelch-like protein 18
VTVNGAVWTQFCIHTLRISVTGDSLSTVEVYDPIVGRWQLAEAMTMLRSRVGVAVMRNRLYAFGGYNGSERLSTVEVFDPQKRAWSRVSPMQCKRRLVHIIDTSKLQ